MRPHHYHLVAEAAALAVLSLIGCAQTPQPSDVAAAQSALSVEELAKQCGLECSAKGIVDGNAEISGVASVDAFFASVVSFQGTGEAVTGDIEAQLSAIRADLGIAADADFTTAFKAQVAANLDGDLVVKAEPAKCTVDMQATLDAEARCDASVDPGKAEVQCMGECDVSAEAEAKCDAKADLECTVTAPSVSCEAECQGRCKVALQAAAKCDGICDGECDSHCDGYAKDKQGNVRAHGHCSGMCKGQCMSELAIAAKCDGMCEGECTTTNPAGGCKEHVRASCKAKANAKLACKGRCQGDFVPPKAKAECEASVKANAKMNTTCTPPRLAVYYQLKAMVAGSAEAAAQAKFVAGIKSLEVRLPALLAAQGRLVSVSEAGANLIVAADDAVKASIKLTLDGDIKPKQVIGLGCALQELGDVDTVVKATTKKIDTTNDHCKSVIGSLGLVG